MITLNSPSQCCGCEACSQICPVQCIEMREDREGFLYPHIDSSACVDCGACEKVCPMIHRQESKSPYGVYAAKNRCEQIRSASSSGGLFTALAEDVLSRSGVVFGAAFDAQWGVRHQTIESREELGELRGAKYSQSKIGNNYNRVKELLEDGREVLFSGTPCQIAALKLLLSRHYDNLHLIDVACHGVASPKVWQQYLAATTNGERVERVNFRDKNRSWSDYDISIQTSTKKIRERAVRNLFMSGFVKDLYLRPSCYDCPLKSNNSGSDFTLADFWGIDKLLPHFDDDRGVSLVIVNSQNGHEQLQTLNIELHEVSYEAATRYNPSLHSSAKEPYNRAKFFEEIEGDMIAQLRALLKAPLHTRIAREVIWGAARLRKLIK